MIGLKEIRRRLKSQETKDITWVMNTSMIFMAMMVVALVLFFIFV